MQRPRHAPTRHAPARHAAETWAAASGMHARVVGAVIMRDLQTRFGTGYFGFLLGLIMPLGHLTIAIGVTTLLGRPTPLGTDTPIFLMTGVLPFILWLYGHRQIMLTLLQNRPLLYFPGVDIFDLFAARIVIEVVSGTLVVLIVLATLAILGHELNVANWPEFIYGLVRAWLMGVATGLIFGCLATLWGATIIAGNILGPLLWVASGVLFLPDGLPEKLRNFLSFNPLCQIVDGVRIAYFSEYSSSFYDMSLMDKSLLVLLALGMTLVPLTRKIT
ncbi:ABC transporter permease [Xanthobacter flavus]|uniref:ABC transporter permease n=1 Tax=Xanthobacter flavus TaxID=281 RepID=UPI00372A63F4